MDPKSTCRTGALTAILSEVTGDEVERMTLTAAEIACARHVCLMITGRDKLATIENAMADPDSDLPIVRLAEMLPKSWICTGLNKAPVAGKANRTDRKRAKLSQTG